MAISPHATVHPSASIEDGAEISAGVKIGAYSCVGANVTIAEDVTLMQHSVVSGHTKLEPQVKIFPFASVGTQPQDLKYRGEKTFLEIGDSTVIREHVTINTGTVQGGGVTRIGSHCLLMVGAHVAHDCDIGNHVILVNNATCAGHVQVGDGAVLGGLCAIHQFVRIGNNAMIGGMTGVERDVIPYGSVIGNRARLKGLNVVGLKRQNLTRDEIRTLRKAYQELFEDAESDVPLLKRAEQVAQTYHASPQVLKVIDFILSESSRAFCIP